MGKKKKDLPPLPVRVVWNKNGNACTPESVAKEHKITPDIVFVRDDGWTLGAPMRFANAAYDLWKKQWTHFYFTKYGRDMTFTIDHYPKFMPKRR